MSVKKGEGKLVQSKPNGEVELERAYALCTMHTWKLNKISDGAARLVLIYAVRG